MAAGARRLRRSPEERAAIARAKARLDTLGLYPSPVRVGRVRILHTPWLFRLPWFRRFAGYNMAHLILLKHPLSEVSDELVTHELCHVGQDQDHRLRMGLSYWLKGYARNPHEIEARRAAGQGRRR